MVKRGVKRGEYNVNPNKRQRGVFRRVVNDGESVSRAMVKENYSVKTSHNPDKIKKSRGWQRLLETYLPDESLTKKHKELLEKKEIARVFDHGTGEWIQTIVEQPHSDVKGALDMAYKLKKKYPGEGEGGTKVNVVVISREVAERHGVIVQTNDSRTSSGTEADR